MFIHPVKHEDVGLGGAVKIWLASDGGCGSRLHYFSSQVALGYCRRSCVAFATALCFPINGHGSPTYSMAVANKAKKHSFFFLFRSWGINQQGSFQPVL